MAKPAPVRRRKAKPFVALDAGAQYGRVGVPRTGSAFGANRGRYDEETQRTLKGGLFARTARLMATTDATLGACDATSLAMFRRVPWGWKAPDDTPKSRERVEWAEGMFTDMRHKPQALLTDALLIRRYGWAAFNIVVKRRRGPAFKLVNGVRVRDPLRSSRFTDGLLGIADLSPRAQESLLDWEWDDEDNLVGMWQRPKVGRGRTDVFIPIDALLHLKTQSNRDDPEGFSPLRPLVRAWRLKVSAEDDESVGIKKDATGTLVGEVPSDYLSTEATSEKAAALEQMRRVLSGSYRNELENFFWPSDENFRLRQLESGGARAYNTHEIIQRWDRVMASAWNMQFLAYGGEGKGSQALSLDTTDMYEATIDAYLDVVEEAINEQVLAPLWEMNGIPEEERPRYEHGPVARRDLGKYMETIRALCDGGIVMADRSLEQFVREELQLPPADDPDEHDDDDLPGDDIPHPEDDGEPEPPAPEPEPEPTQKRRRRITRLIRRHTEAA